MSAVLELRPVDDVVRSLGETLDRREYLVRELGHTGGHRRLLNLAPASARPPEFGLEPCGRIDGPGEPVHRYVRQHLVAVDRTCRIRPLAELLRDPCEQARRRVRQAIGEGLRPAPLDHVVAGALLLEAL